MSRTRQLAIAACAALASPSAAATAETRAEAALEARAPCSAHVEVRPARAVAGQQVAYVVRIVRRDDVRRVEWSEPLRFPGLRAEWLPGRAEDETQHAGGHAFRVREEARALFAARPGRFEIPRAALACYLDGEGGNARRVHTAPVPAARLDVEPPPAAGRPPDFSGLVGRIRIQTVASAVRLALGRSLHVSVSLRGAANLWDAPSPFASPSDRSGSAAFGGAEVFAARPETDLEAGPELFVRRTFRFDVLPQATGRLVVPAVHVPYYDPELGAYATASSEPIEVRVEAAVAGDARAPVAPASASRGSAAPETVSDEPGRMPDPRELPLPLGALGLVAAVFALGAGVLGREAWARRRQPWRAVEQALRAADAAAESGNATDEATALARALRRALAADLGRPDWADLDTSELANRLRGGGDPVSPARRAALDALENLDRVRFGTEGAAPRRSQVERAIRGLR